MQVLTKINILKIKKILQNKGYKIYKKKNTLSTILKNFFYTTTAGIFFIGFLYITPFIVDFSERSLAFIVGSRSWASKSSCLSSERSFRQVGCPTNAWKLDCKPCKTPVGRPAACGLTSMPSRRACSARLYILLFS